LQTGTVLRARSGFYTILTDDGATVESHIRGRVKKDRQASELAVIGDRVGAALEETWLEPVRSAANARDGILKVLDSLARELDAQGSVRGCPVNNLTLELAFADPDFRAELKRLFDLWRSTIAERLSGRKNGEALATLVVAAYSGAMAMAKVEQRGEPLRLCARELKPLLSGA